MHATTKAPSKLKSVTPRMRVSDGGRACESLPSNAHVALELTLVPTKFPSSYIRLTFPVVYAICYVPPIVKCEFRRVCTTTPSPAPCSPPAASPEPRSSGASSTPKSRFAACRMEREVTVAVALRKRGTKHDNEMHNSRRHLYRDHDCGNTERGHVVIIFAS